MRYTNNIKASFTQVVVKNNEELQVGFTCSDKTNIGYNEIQIKQWLGMHLHLWYKLQDLQWKPVFNLIKPIKIVVEWNNKVVLTLMQVRISKKLADNLKGEMPIPVKKSFYLLRNYKSMQVEGNKTVIKKVEVPARTQMLNQFHTDSVFNTIEFFAAERFSYGSPILYTGMSN